MADDRTIEAGSPLAREGAVITITPAGDNYHGHFPMCKRKLRVTPAPIRIGPEGLLSNPTKVRTRAQSCAWGRRLV